MNNPGYEAFVNFPPLPSLCRGSQRPARLALRKPLRLFPQPSYTVVAAAAAAKGKLREILSVLGRSWAFLIVTEISEAVSVTNSVRDISKSITKIT